MRVRFPELAKRLATDAGGFTLWVGAGASIALTSGKTPSWRGLVEGIASAHSVGSLAASTNDMPLLLEELAQQIGHAVFRRELRKRIVEAAESASLDIDVLVAQAIIGCRAAALVSFNIEQLSALPLTAGGSGSTFVGRTFRERSPFSHDISITTTPGICAPPVYFPHGLLFQGNVVMTKSEYDKHLGSLAVTTAVHLAIGGDLVILGMSLGDPYLRDAILQNRRWLREVYWLGETNGFAEWARVADVTFVSVGNAEVWRGLAGTMLAHDETGALEKVDIELRSKGLESMKRAADVHRGLVLSLAGHASHLVSIPQVTSAKLHEFAEYCISAGYDIPDVILDDPRYDD